MVHCNNIAELLQRPTEGSRVLTQIHHLSSNTSITRGLSGFVSKLVVGRLGSDQNRSYRGVYPVHAATATKLARMTAYRRIYPAQLMQSHLRQFFTIPLVRHGRILWGSYRNHRGYV